MPARSSAPLGWRGAPTAALFLGLRRFELGGQLLMPSGEPFQLLSKMVRWFKIQQRAEMRRHPAMMFGLTPSPFHVLPQPNVLRV